MSENIFLKPIEFYTRELDPVEAYINQNSFYLSKMTGKNRNECINFIKDGIYKKQFKDINNPVVTYFEREDNEDKFKKECRLTEYFKAVRENQEILVPTFTSYINAEKKPSLLVEFVDYNVARRSKAKKEAFKAKAEQKMDLFINKNNEQANKKLYNNALSGGFATEGSVLNNPTAHSTLTSMTRMESSIGNASNEKIIAGNRFYKDPYVTLNNIITIVNSINRDELKHIIEKYNLYYPTYEDVISCIKYSSDLYWKDEKAFQNIYNFVIKLDDLERAGFVYISDLYHLRKYNDNFIRTFLTSLSSKITNKTYEDPISIIKNTNESIVNVAHQICMKETKGIGKDYSKMNLLDLNTLAATCENIYNIILKHKDFIDNFFLTKNMPLSAGYIPTMMRRTVVLSDTDSTMFSVDEYITWYFGKLVFSDEAFALAAIIMYIATECIAHQLAIYSANINVSKSKLFKIAMKPEFTFPVFAQTSVAKHYFTYKIVQEGNVFKDSEIEIKGVHLKNSAAPKILIQAAQNKMKEILFKIADNKKIKLTDEIKEVANIERKLISELLNGNIEFYKRTKIKSPEAYVRSEEQSPYVHYLLWENVFEPKYGKLDKPPFDVIKIPTKVSNVTELKKWLNSISDEDFRNRLAIWMEQQNKICLPTILISSDYVRAYGIPQEIKPIIDIEGIALELTKVNRMILESLGYFPKQDLLFSHQGY